MVHAQAEAVTSMDLDRTELDILITCVDRQLTRFDETWGNAEWRREHKFKTTDAFYQAQAKARARAGDLLARIEAERGV
jgi:hypothetical protein